MNSLRQPIEVEKSDFFMPYAPLIRVKPGGDLLFLSGCAALPLYHAHPHDPTVPVPEGIGEQTRLCMENIQKCLDAASASWKDVVKLDLFVTEAEAVDEIGAVMGEFLQGDFPTSTLVGVTSLVEPRLKIEISAIAVVPSAD